MNGYDDYTPSWSVYGSYYPYNNWGYGRGGRWGGYGGRWGGRSNIGVGIGFGW
jgi:hypothetical protein